MHEMFGVCHHIRLGKNLALTTTMVTVQSSLCRALRFPFTLPASKKLVFSSSQVSTCAYLHPVLILKTTLKLNPFFANV